MCKGACEGKERQSSGVLERRTPRIHATTRRKLFVCECHNEANCDDKLLNFARNSCQLFACKLDITPLSFGKALLVPIRVQVH
jgi:hypothetical protein